MLGTIAALQLGSSAHDLAAAIPQQRVYAALVSEVMQPTAAPVKPVNFLPDNSASLVASPAPVVISFTSDGDERYEVVGAKKTSNVKKDDLVAVMNPIAGWAPAPAGASWITYGTGATGIKIGSVIRFTEQVALSQRMVTGMIGVFTSAPITVAVDGKQIYTGATDADALSRTPALITLPNLAAGTHTITFDLTQGDMLEDDGLALAYTGYLMASPRAHTQKVPGGSSDVKLGTLAYLSSGTAQSLRYLKVSLTSDPLLTSDELVHVRLIDEVSGKSISDAPSCTSSNKRIVCMFGSQQQPLDYALTSTPFGSVRMFSLFADLPHVDTATSLQVAFEPGLENIRSVGEAATSDLRWSTPATPGFSLIIAE